MNSYPNRHFSYLSIVPEPFPYPDLWRSYGITCPNYGADGAEPLNMTNISQQLAPGAQNSICPMNHVETL